MVISTTFGDFAPACAAAANPATSMITPANVRKSNGAHDLSWEEEEFMVADFLALCPLLGAGARASRLGPGKGAGLLRTLGAPFPSHQISHRFHLTRRELPNCQAC